MPDETATATTTETPPTAHDTAAPETPPQPIKPALFDEPPDPNPTQTDQPVGRQSQPDQPNPETAPETEILTAQDITLPEGATYDEELGNSFLGIVNDTKLTRKELAQKLFDLYRSQEVKMLEGLNAVESERAKKFEAEMEAEKAEWLKQCQADSEYGGQNWEASQAVIDRGCRELATPEAIALLKRYNLNTHPEIVRMFHRAGKLVGEDSSRVTGTGTGKEIDPAMAIFGESLKEYHRRKGEMQ